MQTPRLVAISVPPTFSPPPSSPSPALSIPLSGQPPPPSVQDEEEDDFMQDGLRDLGDGEDVHIREYGPDSDAFAGFHDIEEKVEEVEELGEPEEEAHQSPTRTVRRRGRPRAIRRQGRRLGCKWMDPRNPEAKSEKHLLKKLKLEETECPYCGAYQYPEECGSTTSAKNYWHCCSNGRVHRDMIQTAENDPDGLEILEDGEAKEAMRAFEDEAQNSLHKLMHVVQASETNPDVEVRTQASKDFQELIISYNNVLSFCSELAAVDYKNSGWATFKSMGRGSSTC
ncbi:MAG: hypothetical protein Q9223_007938 [Gallowayella weberi]